MQVSAKSIFSLLLVFVMMLSVVPLSGFIGIDVTVNAAEETSISDETATVIAEGECGPAANWILYSNGILVISGSGYLYANFSNYDDEYGWENYIEQITHIEVQEGITALGNYAFDDFISLETISLPDSLEDICQTTFQNCSQLKEIVVPKKVSQLDDGLFNNCISLEKLVVLNPAAVIEYLYGMSYDYQIFGYTGSTAEVYAKENNKVFLPICTGTGDRYDSHFDSNHDIECELCGGKSLVAEGNCGKNATWQLFTDGFLRIKGTGEINNGFSVFSDFITKVEVSDGVTSIGDDTFQFCVNLEEISLPDSLTSIKTWVFENCKALKRVVIPESVTALGDYAFRYCDNLEEIVLPEGLQEIGIGAFHGCSSLKKVVVPKNVKVIKAAAFGHCASLEEVVLPEGLLQIAASAFGDNYASGESPKLTSIHIPASVTYIASSAITEYMKNITVAPGNQNYTVENGVLFSKDMSTLIRVPNTFAEYTVPSSVKTIGAYAFSGNDMLESVVIPETVKTIRTSAFERCSSLKTIKIPDSISEICRSTFEGCHALYSVDLPNNLESIGRDAFRYCYSLRNIELPSALKRIEYAAFYKSGLESIYIPDSVVFIGELAFEYCTDLVNVRLSENITEIPNGCFRNTGIKSITIPDNVKDIYYGGISGEQLEEIICSDELIFRVPEELYQKAYNDVDCWEGGALYLYGTLYAVKDTYVGSFTVKEGTKRIEVDAFSGCEEITEIIMPDSVTEVGSAAFWNCTGLESVKLSENLKKIEDRAFYNCTSLENISIPESVEYVDYSAFYNTAFYNNEDNWTSGCLYANDVLIKAKNDLQGSLTVADGTRIIASEAFNNCHGITDIDFPESVISIGDSAFSSCTSIESIVIPPNVSEIPVWAFYNCNNLKNVVLHDNITRICSYAFSSCESLTEIKLPVNLKAIEVRAFYACPLLKDVVFNENLEIVEDAAFNGSAIEVLDLPESLIDWESYNLPNVNRINSLGNVTELTYNEFLGYESLAYIKLPTTLKSIGDKVFSPINKPQLSEVDYEGCMHQWEKVIIGSDNDALTDLEINFDIGFEVEAIEKASCDKDGLVTYICQCGETKTEIIPKREHKYDEGVIDPDATCTGTGIKTFTCTNTEDDMYEKCEHSYSEEIGALDHELGEWYTVIAATCTKEGQEQRDCTRAGCDYYEIRNTATDKTAHTEDSKYTVTHKASCEADGEKAILCTECGETLKTEAIAKRIHVYDEGKITTAPDCENAGEITFTCTNTASEEYEACTHSYSAAVKAIGHDMGEWYTVTEPTCTKEGLEKCECKRSGCDYSAEKAIAVDEDAHTKDDELIVTKKASCFEKGEMVQKCTECGDILATEEISVRKHVYDEGKVTTAPSCISSGEITYTCTNTETEKYVACTHSYTETVDNVGHDMGEWFTVTEASCTKEGLERRECQRDACEYFEERSTAVDKNAHTEDDSYTVTKKASCTEDGEKVKKCTECGEVLVLDVISKREHIYDEGVVTSAPSCVSEGEITYTCTNIENNEYEACTHSYTEAIRADGHDMGSWYIEKEAEYHVPGVERRDCQTENCDYYETREYEIAVPVYVATFVIGDEIISKVEFEHGATFIKEPAIPEKTNYIGIWEDYEIVNENFTVEGYYELIDSDTVSTLQEDKQAQYKNDVAQITLSAFAPTKIVEYASPNSEPLDIVLVLDQSGSMAQRLNGSTTKKDALKKSANAFLNEVLKNGEAAGVEHRVAVVGFAYGANYSYNNTELLSYVSNGRISPVKYNTIKKNASSMEKYYSNAFLPISDGNGINDLLTSAISNVDAEGATAADFGLEMASKIFDYNYTDPSEGRKKIVLFITDGEPNYHSGFDTAVANAAIGEAFAIKQSGCNIYSVGISADADPDIFDNSNKSFNRFLHLVSSNYRNASTMISSGMGDKNNGFYLAVNNTDNLGKLFEVIVSRAVNKTVAFDNVTLVDTISSEFTLTSQQEDKLREELFNTHGLTDENLEVTRNDDGTTTMKFIGLKPEKVFENGVNTGFKVSVTFEVTPNEKALNKGIYKTNTSDAGVELGGDRVAVFAIPEISIPENRNIVTFKIGNEVYSIVNGKIGDPVTAPECEYAEWNVPEGTVISDRAFTFTADGVADDKYAVTWVINGESYVEYYTIGSKLNPPAVKAEEGFMFVGFAPYVPSRMPARNIVLTAKFEEHEHKYEETLSGGTCDTGLVMRYSCFCGSAYTETLAAQAHKYSATVINSEEKLEDAFVCEYCYKMLDATLSFCYSGGTDNSEFYSLEMKKGEINVQPDGTVTVKIPLTADMAQEVNNGRGIKVYRIESGNTKTFVDSYVQDDAFVVMTLDHFSYYVLGLTGSDGNLLEDVNFATVKCAVDGHSYTKNVIPPDCTNRGYTIYTCGTCGYSYEGDFVGMTDHKDSDGDLYCDDCGKDISAVQNCGHLCHKDGFLGFIWKIVRFFIKLFGTNSVCSCGRAHY